MRNRVPPHLLSTYDLTALGVALWLICGVLMLLQTNPWLLLLCFVLHLVGIFFARWILTPERLRLDRVFWFGAALAGIGFFGVSSMSWGLAWGILCFEGLVTIALNLIFLEFGRGGER